MDLLESVEFKIALADSSEKLSGVLGVLLCPLLRKLAEATGDQQSTTKILSILTHINKRTKTTPEVKLPIVDLVKLFREPQSTLSVKTFALMYIDMGMEPGRTQSTSTNEVLEQILQDLFQGFAALKSFQMQQTIFGMFLRHLRYFKVDFERSDLEQDSRAFMSHVLDFMLYTPENIRSLPVLILSFFKQLFQQEQQQLEVSKVKVALLRLLNDSISSATIVGNDSLNAHLFVSVLAASSDADPAVVACAEDLLKRRARPSLEDVFIVAKLYSLFLGTNLQQSQPQLGVFLRQPVGRELKYKILNLLAKSERSCNTMPFVLQVIFESLFGADSNSRKVRVAGMGFMQWVIRMASQPNVDLFAPTFLGGLLKVLKDEDQQQQNSSDFSSSDGLFDLRSFAYSALGALSKRKPELFTADLTILEFLFASLSSESPNTRSSVQEALFSLVDAYRGLSGDGLSFMRRLLMNYIESAGNHYERLSAAKYAMSAFPSNDPFGILLCLLGSGTADLHVDVREMCQEGLKFVSADHLVPFPVISSLIAHYAKSTDSYRLPNSNDEYPSRNITNTATQKFLSPLKLSANVLFNCIQYLRNILFLSADPSLLSEFGNYNQLSRLTDLTELFEMSQLQPESIEKLQKYVSDAQVAESVQTFMTTFLRPILEVHSAPVSLHMITLVAIKDLLQLLPVSKSSLLASSNSSYDSQLIIFQRFLESSKPECRKVASQIIAMVYAEKRDQNDAIRYLESLNPVNNADEFDKLSGVDLQLGRLMAYSCLVGRLASVGHPVKDVNVSKHLQLLKSTDSYLKSSAMECLSEMLKFHPVGTIATVSGTAGDCGKVILESLQELIKSGKDEKLVDLAVKTLGHISLADNAFAQTFIDDLFEIASSKSKQLDIQLSAAETLCLALSGWSCKFAHLFEPATDRMDVTPASNAESTKRPIAQVLDRILKDYLSADSSGQKSPAARKSVCIWLLYLMNFCGGAECEQEIQKRLEQIHQSFSAMLSSVSTAVGDDFIQECASNGIAIVYQMADDSIKETFVKSLMKETSSKSTGSSGSSETAGSTDTMTSSNSLYKQLLSLASIDLQRPELVYKFLILASFGGSGGAATSTETSKMWKRNSRLGSQFAQQKTIERFRQELAGLRSQLLPKLYRCTFDPNAKVADGMRAIWQVLFAVDTQSRKIIDDPVNFQLILTDLLQSMADGRRWRVREQSCSALSSLLATRDLMSFKDQLEKIWTQLFKSMDDVKESVRQAAFSCCKTLSNMVLRVCQQRQQQQQVDEKSFEKILSTVIAFMLHQGIVSSVEEVKRFSLNTLLELTKRASEMGGGSTGKVLILRPFAADLISILLESMSSYEPQILNYLTFHVDEDKQMRQQLDYSRMNAVKMSPIMSAVENCIDQLSVEDGGGNFSDLVPKLLELIRRGVGLPTKAGTSRFITVACIRKPELFAGSEQLSDSLLKALSGAVQDKNIAVRRSFSTSVGYLIKFCSDRQQINFISHLQSSIYCNQQKFEDEDCRESVAYTLQAYSRHSSDSFKRQSDKIIPLLYLTVFDGKEELKRVFEDVLDTSFGGLTVCVQPNAANIFQFLNDQLSSTQSWKLKGQCAQAVSKALELLSPSASSKSTGQEILLVREKMKLLLQTLIQALSGRTWMGKEYLLKSLLSLSKADNCASEDDLKQVLAVLIREAAKKLSSSSDNKVYKHLSLDYLSDFLLHHRKFDEYQRVNEICLPIVNAVSAEDSASSGSLAKKEAEDDDDKSERLPGAVLNVVKSSAFKCLAASYRPAHNHLQITKVLASNCNLQSNSWNVCLAVCEAIGYLFLDSCSDSKLLSDAEMLDRLSEKLFETVDKGKYQAVRESAAKSICAMHRLVPPTSRDSIKHRLRLLSTSTLPPTVKEILQKLH